MARSERGGFLRAMGVMLVGLTICGLAAVVVYLLSDINQRRFRTTQAGDILVIEQGRFFPIGFAAYRGETEALAQAYAPIAMPPHENVGQSITFDDRSALDRALFTLLSGWARSRLEAQDADTLALAGQYVRRAEVLPGIAEEQRQQLRALRADAAFRQAHSMALGVTEQLRRAQLGYQLAIDLGTTHSAAARAGLESAQNKLKLLTQGEVVPPSPAPQVLSQ